MKEKNKEEQTHRFGGLYKNVKMSVKTADIIIAVSVTILLALIIIGGLSS